MTEGTRSETGGNNLFDQRRGAIREVRVGLTQLQRQHCKPEAAFRTSARGVSFPAQSVPRRVGNYAWDILFDRGDEPVATADSVSTKRGLSRGTANNLPQCVDRRVQVVIDVHEGVRPKAPLKILATDPPLPAARVAWQARKTG